MNKKKVTVFLLMAALTLSCPIGILASTEVSKSLHTTEFGTLTGHQEYVGKELGRKNINFEVTTTKQAKKLVAQVDILDYVTGKRLDGDMVIGEKTTRAGYTCDCHSAKANSVPISSYGAHEAYGKNNKIVYTKIINL